MVTQAEMTAIEKAFTLLATAIVERIEKVEARLTTIENEPRMSLRQKLQAKGLK